MNTAPTVLIVEDERDLSSVVERYLMTAGYRTHVIEDGREVREWVESNRPDVVLLDLMLPGKDGLTLCREIRTFSEVPIIMVTAKTDEVDRLLGLDLGADDYVCKPYSVRELVARVRVIIRRLGFQAAGESGDLQLDEARYQVGHQGRSVVLTAVEFKLFRLLYDHPGRIYSREQIIDLVYSDYRVISDRTVDSHIRNLRRKLDDLELGDEVIHSIYGAGYKYEPASRTG